MIQVFITEKELRFESRNSGKQFAIQCAAHAEVFGHPRHLMVNLELARPLLTAAMKAVAGFTLLPPTVKLHIDRAVAGGLVDVDYQVAKQFFIYAGAKKVEVHGR